MSPEFHTYSEGKESVVMVPVSSEPLELKYDLREGGSLSIYLVYDKNASLASDRRQSSVKISVNLGGKDAKVKIRGVFDTERNEKCSIKTLITHSCEDCTSEQLFKNVAKDSSKVDFEGRILVAHGSFGTDASQQCHSLLLSDEATVSTSPQLEIYADDVKCSHGATIGKIDENVLFYMQSRGISLERAKALQIESFLNEINDFQPDTPLYERLCTLLARCGY